MSYTIIGQNNSVTTIDDGNGHTLHVPSRVALAIGTTFTITEVNNNMATLTDSNGKVYRDIPCVVDLVGSGGGGSVDYSKTVQKSNTIPAASSSNAGQVYLYTGATNASFTQNYIYKNVKSATYTGTVSFEAATLSGTTVTCDGDDFANFLTEAGADPTPIVSGSMTYEADATGWRLVGKDSNGDTVTTFLEYVEDYQDAGLTFTGTPQDGDVIAFTCTVEEASATYAWTRIDVQPTPETLPDQTGQSGKFLTTNGTSASWSDKPLVNNSTSNSSISVGGESNGYNDSVAIGNGSLTRGETVAIGKNAQVESRNISIGCNATAKTSYGGSVALGYNANADISSAGWKASVAIGANAKANASGSIQISATKANSTTVTPTNSDANTFKVSNDNGNYEIMSADGTIPAARHASLPASDGTYVLKLVISGGVPTLSWVAE